MFASDLQNTQGSAWGRTLPTVARELQAEKHGSAKAPNHYSCQAAPKLFSWPHAATPDLTVVTDAYTTTGHGTGRVLRVNCNFTNPADPWRRLTTSGAPNWPDPVIDFTRKPQFDLYAADHRLGPSVLPLGPVPAGAADVEIVEQGFEWIPETAARSSELRWAVMLHNPNPDTWLASGSVEAAFNDAMGLYDKPMARNVQLWTDDYQLLLDGPHATPEHGSIFPAS